MEPAVELVLHNPFLLRKLLLETDYDTVINYCRSYYQAQEICYDKLFWIQKAEQKLNVPREMFESNILFYRSPAQRYLQLLTKKGEIAHGSERYILFDEFVKKAIRAHREDLVKYSINRGFNNWMLLLEEYAGQGNKERVNYFLNLILDNNNKYQNAAEGALRGGQIELFNYIQSITPPNFNFNVYGLLINSVVSNNINLFDSILSLIPQNPNEVYENFAKLMVYIALSNGNKEIFDHIRIYVPMDYDWNWENMLDSVLESSNPTLIDYIITLFPMDFEWNKFIEDQLDSTHIISGIQLKKILSHAPKDYGWNWNNLAKVAILNEDKQLFDHIRSLAPVNYEWDWNNLAASAASVGNILLFNYIFNQLAPLNYFWNINYIMNITQDKDLRDYLRPLIPGQGRQLCIASGDYYKTPVKMEAVKYKNNSPDI